MALVVRLEGETMCLLAFLTGVSFGFGLLALVLWLLSS